MTVIQPSALLMFGWTAQWGQPMNVSLELDMIDESIASKFFPVAARGIAENIDTESKIPLRAKKHFPHRPPL